MYQTQELETACDDPLLSVCELPLRATFFPLGFPLELTTNSYKVIEAAKKSWQFFTQSFDVPPVQLEIGVADEIGGPMPEPPTFRSRGHLMSIISDAQNFSNCDFSRGFAYGWVTRRVAAESEFFRYNFLEPAALTLLGQRYLAPVHAALVVKDGCGVMLCGDSFAGKSTLAYACARAGWTFVTDDAVYLVREDPRCFGIGNPYSIRFRESAAALFEELSNRPPVIRPNGKVGFEICTQELALDTAPGNQIHHVVFLDRHTLEPAHLFPFPKARAMHSWKQFVNHGEEQTKTEQIKSYERLLKARVWALNYSNLNKAVLRLDQLAESGHLETLLCQTSCEGIRSDRA
jgi:hypothetical protein